MDFDVAVVGAGAAGLIAARELARNGRSVVLFEASDRFGGRLRSVDDPRAGGPIDLGAEFVHGRPEVTYALLREIGANVIDNGETSFELRDGVLTCSTGDRFERAHALLARAGDRENDESVDALLARFDANDRHERESIDSARRLVAGFDAADPSVASARAIAAEWAGDASADGAQSRPAGGYKAMIDDLARSLDPSRVAVRRRTIVTRIERDSTGATLHYAASSGTGAVRARRVIVTIPIGVLRAEADNRGAIAFEPVLPQQTRRAISLLAMGPVIKPVLVFRERFWEQLSDGAWRDGAFFSGAAPFQAIWTQMPVRMNTLTAWLGGSDAQPYLATSDDERTRLALEAVATLFGDAKIVYDTFEIAHQHDWQADPFARGAYSYALVGGEAARGALAQPVDGVLWFAGEATASDGEEGTVAGALQSGLRSAREIISQTANAR